VPPKWFGHRQNRYGRRLAQTGRPVTQPFFCFNWLLLIAMPSPDDLLLSVIYNYRGPA
jgi:hypothetical protein